MRTLEVELLLKDKECRLLDVFKNETVNTTDSKLMKDSVKKESHYSVV